MEQNTCLNCGEKFLVKQKGQCYCSSRCRNNYNSRKRRNELNGFFCPHNEGVECHQHNCTTCGWNPTVSAARIAAIKGAVTE